MAFTFSSTGGSSGETSINVSATTNIQTSSIVEYYTLSNTSGHSVSMALTQKAAQPVVKYISIKPSSFEVEPKPSNSSIQIGSNDRWIIVSNSWIGLAPQYDKGDNTQRMAERSRGIIEAEDPEEKYNILQGSGNTIVGISFAENSGETRTGFISGYCISDTAVTAYTSVVQIGAGANPKIIVYPDLIPALPASGLTSALTVTSNIEWTASTTDKYVHITSESESSGNGTVHFTVDPNTDGYSRVGGIKVTNEKYNVVGYFSFKQLPKEMPFIKVYPVEFKVSSTGSTGNTIHVDSNCEYRITTDSNWIHLDSNTGYGFTTIMFTTDPSTKANNDNGIIEFTNDEYGLSTIAEVSRANVEFYLSASTNYIDVALGSEQITIVSLFSNVNWNVNVDQGSGKPWLNVSPSSGSENGTLTITISATQFERTGTVQLYNNKYNLSWNITVHQG